MNLLFAADRGYMEHVMYCIGSILRFPSEDGYDIYILHSDLQEEEIRAYSGQIRDPGAALHFRHVDPALFDAFPENPRYPKQIYYRIFAAGLLPDQDILTALYGEKTGLLDTMKYNLSDRILNLYNSDFTHERRDLDWVRKIAVIIHYYGVHKPWKKRYQGKLDIFYRELKDEQRMNEGGS